MAPYATRIPVPRAEFRPSVSLMLPLISFRSVIWTKTQMFIPNRNLEVQEIIKTASDALTSLKGIPLC